MQTELNFDLQQTFVMLQGEFARNTYPIVDERIALLKQLRGDLITLTPELIRAANQDFGSRSRFDTEFADILPTVTQLDYICKHLKRWLKPHKRAAGMQLWPSKLSVELQPKGVVGVIAPWNYPIQLALLPAFTAIAAGNRVMLKLSEFTPAINQVLRTLFANHQSWCKVVEGGAEVAAHFSALPFAHLFFTGSTTVGKKVMQAASQHLTPVTLELGGKSPAIVTRNADLDCAAAAIILGKTVNAGQICVAPDYVLVHETQYLAFIQALKRVYAQYFKAGADSKELTAIINDSQFARLQGLLSDARLKGANVEALHPQALAAETRKMAVHVVTDVNEQMRIMQDEIFGPLLPVITYHQLDEAIDYVCQHPHPLAAYVFSSDRFDIEQVRLRVQSGSLVVNETLLQVTAEAAPFGGIGNSGMGHYHGREGVETFSHKRTVLQSQKLGWRIHLLLARKAWLLKPVMWLFMRK
ncbi:coniferyl aldehyde dehydrogenase [Pseudoalteromonas fenneropenaei]|uniref:Aldehyde dehydrogenase n=1 Tax=Pseudoalteromonas fenneropenaei TaxID=1737459 RepID=A0ABV7CQ25_9GAMM